VASEPNPGSVFAGRYDVKGVLGRGGMGAVYRVYDRDVGDTVALKTLLPTLGGSEEAAERFRREVRLARRITHRNVARIHDLGAHEGLLYLTMELVEGQSLERVLENRLIDVRSGTQQWSERLDSELGDVFDLEDRLGRRIAESLRVGIVTQTHRGDAPPEAVEAYLRGRRRMRDFGGAFTGAEGIIELFERCRELAPDFRPGMSAHAIACLKAWFLFDAAPGRDWEAASRRAVAEAVARADQIAETHLAHAMLAVQDGEYRVAARSRSRRRPPRCTSTSAGCSARRAGRSGASSTCGWRSSSTRR